MRRRFFATLAAHSLAWLAAANAVGLVLAVLLLFPAAGRLLGSVGYGRLLPIHLDLQVYGWCTLPLLGLLFRFLGPERSGPGPLAAPAVAGWSATLVWTAVALAAGRSSGKPFLEWSGTARGALAAGLAFLAPALLDAVRRRLAEPGAGGRVARVAVAIALLPAPVLLLAATSTGVFPPINPDSGGATHASTAGSVLGVVAIVALAPFAIGRRPADGGRLTRRLLALLAVHLGLFALVAARGDASHRSPAQLALLVSLLPWPFLLAAHWRRFAVAPAARPWLLALAGWSAPLFGSGVLAGLPGGNERFKFTDALVAHVHVAIAGVVTALLAIVLVELDARSRLVLARPGAFALWHGGLAVHAAALFALGALEAASPQLVHHAGTTPVATALFALRALGGVAMLAASLGWVGPLFVRLPARRRATAGARTRLESIVA